MLLMLRLIPDVSALLSRSSERLLSECGSYGLNLSLWTGYGRMHALADDPLGTRVRTRCFLGGHPLPLQALPPLELQLSVPLLLELLPELVLRLLPALRPPL